MDIRQFFIATVFATFLLVAAGCAAAPPTPHQLMSQITKDAQGRLQIMSVRTERGSCIAEIMYAPNAPPRIYVLHIAFGQMKNLGALQLNYALTREPTDEELSEDFRFAITTRCLQFITGGYT
mgnify:CR=1 FL=1